MPFTPYLTPDEYAAYGIPDASTAQVASATRQVNGYLGRPEGLIWTPDANGEPCCMASPNPARRYAVAIGAGSNVTVTVPHATFGNQTVGEVVVLDRDAAQKVEACVVTAANGPALTLASVQFDHTAATMDFGLTILEETSLRAGSPVMRTAYAPVAQILSGCSRASFAKVPRQITDSTFALGPLLSAPAAWAQMDTSQWDINRNTGAVTVLPYPLKSALIDVRLRYVAGWSAANLPADIKQAVANAVRAAIDTPFSGNIKVLKAGNSTVERFGAYAFDADTKNLLQPYKFLRVG